MKPPFNVIYIHTHMYEFSDTCNENISNKSTLLEFLNVDVGKNKLITFIKKFVFYINLFFFLDMIKFVCCLYRKRKNIINKNCVI